MLNEFLETTLLYGSGGGKTGKSGSDNADNTLQSNSILRFVELISEGPCEGLVGSSPAERARSILFDKTPLKTKAGKANFKHVNWTERVGTPDQEVLKGHAGVETPFEVGVQVKKGGAGPVRRTIANPDVDSLNIIMRIPALVEQDEDDGSLKKADVSYRINVKPEGADWYVAHTENIKNEKTTSAYQLVHRIDLPEANSWLVEVERITPDAEDEGLANETWWDAYTTKVEGKFTYPHCALIGFEVNAEDLGSQLPQRIYHYRGLKVLVPSNYDPVERTYSGFWDGEFKRAWTNNPVWIFYDLLTNDRYGLGEFISDDLVDTISLYAIAQYCDEKVKSGIKRSNGTNIMEPRYTFNGVIRNREEAWKVLQSIATTWRGMAYWTLGQVFAVADMPADPAKAFSPANVIGGEFTYQGTAKKARHSVVLVSYNDFDNYSEPAVECVVNEEALAEFGWREKSIQLQGCSSRTLARRYGEWVLDIERNETETVDFAASWEHATIRPGEIITIADPRKANIRLGGRVAESTSTTSILLDAPFPKNLSSNYKIYLTRPNGELVLCDIQSWGEQKFKDGESIGWQRVNLSDALPAKVLVNSGYILTANDVVPREYRVIAMKETEKNKFAITALFHDKNKYARVERDKIIAPPPYTLPDKDVSEPFGPKLSERTYLDKAGRIRATLDLSWRKQADDFTIKDFGVWMVHPRKGLRKLGFQRANHIEIEDAIPGEYTFIIRNRSFFNVLSEPLEITYEVAGPALLARPQVGNLELQEREGALADLDIFDGSAISIQWKNKFARSSELLATGATLTENHHALYESTQIRVYDNATNDILRTVNLRGGQYTYNFRHNREDNKKFSRGPSRAVKFRVIAKDKLDRESDPVFLTATNAAPPAPTFSVTQRGTTLQVKIDRPDADDIEGYLVWMSQTSGFTPGPGNLVHDGGRSPVIDVQRGKTYYVICAAYDAFGKSLLNYSAQLMTVIGATVSDGQAPATPTGLSATSLSDTDDQGHIRSMVQFGWIANTESFFDHYEIETQEEGVDFSSANKSSNKHTMRATIGKTYRFRVRACDAQGNKSAWTAWTIAGNPNQVLATKDVTVPEQAEINDVTARPRGLRILTSECVAKNHKKTRIWRWTNAAHATANNTTTRVLVASGPGEVFFDDDQSLSDGQNVWYRAEFVAHFGIVGALSDPASATFQYVRKQDIKDKAVGYEQLDDDSIDTKKLRSHSVEGNATFGDRNFQVVRAQSARAHLTDINWKGDATGTKYNETIVLGKIATIDNALPSTATIFYTFKVRNSVYDDGGGWFDGTGESYIDSQVLIQARKQGAANWKTIRTLTARAVSRGKDGNEAEGDFGSVAGVTTHKISNSQKGKWQYRAVLVIEHRRGNDRDWYKCQIFAAAEATISWRKK